MSSTMKSSAAGANLYTPLTLRLYDFWVLNITNTYGWRCPTNTVLLPFFQQNLNNNHLDVGVGTGYYLAESTVPPTTKVTLCDLNAHSLSAAEARFGREDTACLLHDIFKPLPTEERFESISMFYLLHCLPGPTSRKTAVFSTLKKNLTDDGVLYGATVLAKGVHHNWMGRVLMWWYNR